MSDSSVAITYIIDKGDIKSKKIWSWCFKNNSFIFAAHIPGKHNIEADTFSRKININTQWQLKLKIFTEVTNKFGYPEIDLLATRINASWSCKPEATAVVAFLTDWVKQFS